MQEPQENSHASITMVFRGDEDDVVDELLSLVKRDKWENLEMHYELGSFTAERTDLHLHDFDGTEEEVPLTFALSASWFTSDNEVEVMVEVNEAEQDWTYEECHKLCAEIINAISGRFPVVLDAKVGANEEISPVEQGETTEPDDAEEYGYEEESEYSEEN